MNTARPDLIHCQPASLRDATILAKMSRDFIERGHGWSWQAPRIARCIRDPDCVFLRADLQATGKIAGFAIMDFHDQHEQRAHLNLLAVAPSFRRHGIARTLLEWLEETALVAGIANISLEVRAQNGGGRRFYKRLGYQEVKQIPRYYSGRETAYRLCKQIRDSCYLQKLQELEESNPSNTPS